MWSYRLFVTWMASSFFATCVAASAAERPPNEELSEFREVRTIFRSRCWKCHSTEVQKGELNLETASGIARGSESGPVVVPSKPHESRILEVLEHGEMPPGDERLPPEQIEIIRRWIDQGAKQVDSHSIATTLNQHDVLPILLLRCATCHGRQVQESGLDIRSRDSLLKGGKTGPAVVLGDADASLLIRRIRLGEMPPKSKLASHSVKPVEASELSKLESWIDAGAPLGDIVPDVATTEPDPLVTDQDRQFWSFQAPMYVAPPWQGVSGSTNPIDAFVEQRLRSSGLTFAPLASRVTLLRRVCFDLVGFPPTPEEAREFLDDPTPAAYERLVDRLLASPDYGERWAQYWLDLAGYCDSEGVQHSDPIRPHAYRYRDYVIRAFNADKPYGRFLLEQLAGDELRDYENAEIITQELYDNLVATGFLRMSADGTFAGITGFVPNRLDVIDDQLRILSSTVLGLTIRCARCHSHKFDPIPQRDYYRLAALMKGAMDEHDWLKPIGGGDGNHGGATRYLPHVTTDELQAWQKQEDQLVNTIDELKKQVAELKNRKSGRAKVEQNKLEKRIRELESQRTPRPMIRALWDRGEPSPTYLLRRGDYLQPARLVGPGVPSVLTDDKTEFVAKRPWPGASKTGNRLALARWLVRPDHPLTARVIVNRIWKHHFGRGIVEPVDDFGRAGGKPTHPALLDWLAVEFVRHGWSIKWLHRLIVTSTTYRQSSQITPDRQRIDPENHLLARMPIRRLEAEVLRDTLLHLADRLDRARFGLADGLDARADGLVVSASDHGAWRRSIYVLKRRTQRLTILDNFDRPRMSPNCVDRRVSTVAPQALHLMNNAMIHSLSKSLAERVWAESGHDVAAQISQLFRLVLNREPNASERMAATEGAQNLVNQWLTHKELAKQTNDNRQREAQARALGNLCHAMINSAALLYVD